MHPVSYFMLFFRVFLCLSNFHFVITCKFIHVLYINLYVGGIDAWVKWSCLNERQANLSYLLDLGNNWSDFAVDNLHSPYFLLCECFPFGTTLSVPFYLFCVQMWIQLDSSDFVLFHLHLCRRLFHISTPFYAKFNSY